jgi:hypothetical protein
MKAHSDSRHGQRADLELFVRKYFGHHGGLVHGDKPDLTIDSGCKRIGVEHTRIYRSAGTVAGLQPQAQLALQHRIVNCAWQRFRALSSRRLWLLVHFDRTTTYTKRESQVVGDSLARVVHEGTVNLPYQPDTIVWHELESWRHQSLGREFPKGVSQIDLQIVDGNPKLELWGPTEAYMVPDLSVEVVRERVVAKEKRLNEYLSKCDEVWLLMVLDTGVSSNHFEIHDDLLETEFFSSFSKLMLLRALHSELFELKTRPHDA